MQLDWTGCTLHTRLDILKTTMQLEKNRLFYSLTQCNKENSQALCQTLSSELRMMCPLPALTHAVMASHIKQQKTFHLPTATL